MLAAPDEISGARRVERRFDAFHEGPVGLGIADIDVENHVSRHACPRHVIVVHRKLSIANG